MRTPWLIPPSEDVGRLLSELANHPEDPWKKMGELALTGLNLNQLARLAKAIEGLPAESIRVSPLRVAVMSNGTTDLIEEALLATGPRFGLYLERIRVPFGQMMQEVVSSDSLLTKKKPDVVLVCIDHRGFRLIDDEGLQDALNYLKGIQKGIHDNSSAFCIFQTVARPPETLFGSFDRQLETSDHSLTSRLNQEIVRMAGDRNDFVLDVSTLAENVGLERWHDPKQWHLAKFLFSQEFIPLYADHVCRLVSAARGKGRRCLILDLDNTLWGGVVGDDGLEGIVIGQGDALGEAYLDFQKTLLKLRERGIVLAVCSKNEEGTAKRVFLEHPDMLLKLDHFASFRANWNDKVANIREIADELSLGLDSFVFVDDNPVERKLVRDLLPEVAVPELPQDVAFFSRTLLSAGYFEAVSYSEEDRLRAESYQANRKRESLHKQATNLDDFLHSLAMQLEFSRMDGISRNRVAQLINKSNQFNVTTKRYTLQEIEELDSRDSCHVIQVRLRDKFGDNGIISVLICNQSGNDLIIDTWVMSCRVLGRCIEEAILNECRKLSRELRCTRILGTYIPTDRNELVSDLYERLEFSILDTSADGTTKWSLPVESTGAIMLPFEIVSKLGPRKPTVLKSA